MFKFADLWNTTNRNGETYLSGRLNENSHLMILPNTNKKSDKDPDFVAYVSSSGIIWDKDTMFRAALKRNHDIDTWLKKHFKKKEHS